MVSCCPCHKLVSLPNTDNILVAARPREVTFTSDGKTAYVTCEVGGEVVKLDVEQRKVVATPKRDLETQDCYYLGRAHFFENFIKDNSRLEIYLEALIGAGVPKYVWQAEFGENKNGALPGTALSSKLQVTLSRLAHVIAAFLVFEIHLLLDTFVKALRTKRFFF